MDKEKYLIFGSKLTSEDIANQDTTVQMTTSLVDPLSLLTTTAGTDGILEVQLLKHSGHTAGSAYTTTNGEYFTINSSGYTMGSGDGVATIIAASSDGVNGVTLDASTANNDFRVNLLQHIDGGTLACFPMSKFKGMQLVNDTTTDLYFEAGTGDLDAVDVVLVTHGAGKFKQLVEMVNDAMSSSGPSVVNFFIGGNGGATGTTINAVAFNGNPAAITDVTIQLDS
jgi:hypothetical protein